MALFRRRRPEPAAPEKFDYDEMAKAMLPAIAAVRGGNTPTGTNMNPALYSSHIGSQIPVPLPRGDDFDSQFGPGFPLGPDPLDPLGLNGRTAPRRSQYLVAWNLQLADRQTPWTMLRWLAEDCDLVSRCIQLTQDEQCGFEWGWSFSKGILQQIMEESGEQSSAAATKIARNKFGADLLRVQQFFESPDRDENQSFVDWLQALLWDHLVYDGVAVYPHRNMDGSLRNLELIDASTIKILRDNRGRTPLAPAPAYQQVLYGFPRGEFQHDPDGGDGDYFSDQLSYFIRRPRNTSVYGFPQVEMVMSLATTYLGRQAWMREEYTGGAMGRVYVKSDFSSGLGANSMSLEQLAQYEMQLNDKLSGQTTRRQMHTLFPPGLDPVFAPQIEEHYKSDYDNWLISQIGSKFGRPPTLLGVQAKAGLSGGKQMEGESNQADIYSGSALTQWIIGLLNTLARRYLGIGPEITATVLTGGSEEDILQKAQADASDVNSGIRPRNEVRGERGLPLSTEPEADQLSITTGSGVTFLSGQLAAQQLAQEQQQELAAAGVLDPAPVAPASPAPGQDGGPPAPSQPGSAETPPAPAAPAAKADQVDPEERLRRYWAEGEGAAKIGWGVPGDFDRCRVELGKYVDAGEVDGFCARLHKRATGAWPGHAAGESKKAEGDDPPKGEAARAAIVTHYTPVIADAMKALYPKVAEAARRVVGRHRNAAKAASPATSPDEAAVAAKLQQFLQQHPADTAQLQAALTALYTDAWVVGLQSAKTGKAGATIQAHADTVDPGVPYDEWAPGWGTAAALIAPPAALAVLLVTAAVVASKLAEGLMNRISSAVTGGLNGTTSASDMAETITGFVDDPSKAAVIATTETTTGTETAAVAAYNAAGITGWNWVLDANPCNLCQARAAGNPYGPGAEPPPAHPGCGCGTEPDTEDD